MAANQTPSPNSSAGRKRPAVFLDRDGTLNVPVVRDGKPYPPATVEEFQLFDGVPAACRALKAAGFALVVATNQPDVGRGTQAQSVVEAMHARLRQLIPEIDLIQVSYDPGRGEKSARRKPEPGMLTEAATLLNLDLASSWMVGDRWRDVDCGKRAGVRTVFIDLGYREELREQPDFIVQDFRAAAAAVIANSASGNQSA